MHEGQASHLQVLEAVAAVVDDPARFLRIIGECRDEDEARTRVMREYGVSLSAANHMLETPFRRLLPSQRERIQQEITVRRHELAGWQGRPGHHSGGRPWRPFG